jgi:hypothetical protein
MCAALLAAALLCAACTGAGEPAPQTSAVTITQTVPAPTSAHPTSAGPTTARPTPSRYVPAPATTLRGVAPGSALPAGEADGTCPYIATQDAAGIEGDRIYRTTVLHSLTPVGCRFYFWCCDYEAIADIVPMTFATAADAYSAMVATGNAGANVSGVKNLVPGVDAVLYQTEFYGPDGATDWAATFAKGRVMVTVHTQQKDISFNAKSFAATIAPKF